MFITPGPVLVSLISAPLKILRKRGGTFLAPVTKCLLAIGLNPLGVRYLAVRTLVGVNFPFPTARKRRTPGFRRLPTLCNTWVRPPILRLLTGLKQWTPTFLKTPRRRVVTDPRSPLKCTRVPWCLLPKTLSPNSTCDNPKCSRPQWPEAATPKRHRPTLLISWLTVTLPLPKTTSRPPEAADEPPSFLKVSLLSTELLLTIVTIRWPELLPRVVVIVTLRVVETEPDVRL